MWISRHVCKYMIVKEIWPLSDRSKRFRNPNVYIRDLDDTTMSARAFSSILYMKTKWY